MPEKLMRWNGSEWVEVSLVRKEVESCNGGGLLEVELLLSFNYENITILERYFVLIPYMEAIKL